MNSTIQIFVAGHDDKLLSAVPNTPAFTAVDLRRVTVEERFDANQFAESRFLVSPEARDVDSTYVGFCSGNYDQKFPKPPHLAALPKLARRLDPSVGLAPSITLDPIPDSDLGHPGMRSILERIVQHFGLDLSAQRVPSANTFVCHRDEWFHLLDNFQPMIDTVLTWYGMNPPFTYRCRFCGYVSDTGIGRHTSDRHMAYLAERLTMLHFATRPNVRFVTPAVFRARQTRVSRTRARLDARVWRRLRGPRPVPSWKTRDIPCPGCTAQRIASSSIDGQ